MKIFPTLAQETNTAFLTAVNPAKAYVPRSHFTPQFSVSANIMLSSVDYPGKLYKPSLLARADGDDLNLSVKPGPRKITSLVYSVELMLTSTDEYHRRIPQRNHSGVYGHKVSA